MSKYNIPDKYGQSSFINHDSIKSKTKASQKFYTFNESINAAEVGEEELATILAEEFKVQDVTKNEEYFDKDIDFIISNNNGQELTLEAKVDFQGHKTRNLFYERHSTGSLKGEGVEVSPGIFHKEIDLEKTLTPGCFEKSQAKYLLYYLYDSKEILIVEFERLRELFKVDKTKFRQATVNNDKQLVNVKVETISFNKKTLLTLPVDIQVGVNELIEEGIIVLNKKGRYAFDKDYLSNAYYPLLKKLLEVEHQEDETTKKQTYFRTSIGYLMPLDYIAKALDVEVVGVDKMNEKLKELF